MLVRSMAIGLAALGLGTSQAAAEESAAQRRLLALETQQLGAEHAAAHARQRELAERAEFLQAPDEPPPDGPPGPPADVGAWETQAIDLPVLGIHAALLPTGKVLLFSYPSRPGYGEYDYGLAYVWDPVTRTSKAVPPPIDPDTGRPTNIWCAGQSLLHDGRVLVVGGNVDDPRTDFHGINRVFTFDPFTETWKVEPRIAQGRWYPTQLLMPNGRTLIVGGLTRPGDRDNRGTNLDLEIFYPEGKIRRVEDFRFADPGRPPAPGLYPKLFWLPQGRAMAAGPQPQDTWFLDTPRALQPTTWTDIPDLSVMREWATTVMLDDGKILSLGGSDRDHDPRDGHRPAMSSSEVFDPAQPGSGWKPGPPMAVGRSHANSILLPDGTVATVGGGYGEDANREFFRWLYDSQQTRVELLDPATGTVKLGPAQAEGRTYHSTALLLPDGTVMSAGDDINGAAGPGSGHTQDTAEIYRPPYLYRGSRPTITSAPFQVAYGSEFVVQTPDSAIVTSAVLMAPSAVTHDIDMSQRRVPLGAVRPVEGGVRVTAPTSLDAAPPGYYMLFLLTADGVPSKASWVRLPLPPQPPDPEPTPAVTPTPSPSPVPTATPAPTARLSLRISPRRLRTLRSSRRLAVSIRLNRAGYVTLAATGDLGRGRRVGLSRARSVRFKRAGVRRVTLQLTPAAVRRLAGRARVRLQVRATARAGTARVRRAAWLVVR